jgi:hypothetical protein
MKIAKINLVGFLVILVISLNAQEIKYGAEIGIDISKPQFSSYSTSKFCFCGAFANANYYAMPSANINGYIELKANDIWGISAEPGFISKDGYLQERGSKSKLYAYNNYFQIPVLFNLYIKKKLFFSIGTEMSLMLFKISKESPNYSNVYPYGLNLFEISGLIGTGYTITEHFDIGLRYSRGFPNILTTPTNPLF